MSRVYWTEDLILSAARDWYGKHRRVPRARDWRNATVATPSAQTVMERFGSWNRMLAKAGIVQRRPHEKSCVNWTKPKIANAMLDWVAVHGRWPRRREWAYACSNGIQHPHERTVMAVYGSWEAAKLAAGWNGVWCCARCGCPRDEFTRGCKTCTQRRTYRVCSKNGRGAPVETCSFHTTPGAGLTAESPRPGRNTLKEAA